LGGMLYDCSVVQALSLCISDIVVGNPEVRLHSIKAEPTVTVEQTGAKQFTCTYIPR